MSDTRPIPRPWEWIPDLPVDTVYEFQPHIVQLVHGEFVDGSFVRTGEGGLYVVEMAEDAYSPLAPAPTQPSEPVSGYRRLVSLRMYFTIKGDGRLHPTFAEILAQISQADLHLAVAFEIEPVKLNDNVNDRQALAAGYHTTQVCLYTQES